MAKPPAPAEETRERLELEDFEVSSGGHFDPVLWLNARLAKSGVAFDKLDQHLSSLAMRCQLLCQDTSESIEVASNQLVTQLPGTGRDLERMRDQASNGCGQLGKVLEGMRDADDKKQSGLQGLAEIDAVKTRVETACSALREVGSWERKVRDCEQLVHAGKLPAALQQLASLKGVLDAFRMLPEYSKKESQLSQLEENLVSTARRRARTAVDRNIIADLDACGEVFASMQRHRELAEIAEAVFSEVAEKAWQGQDPGADTSAAALAVAARAVFEASTHAFRERWPLLQSLDEQAGAGAPQDEQAGAPAAAAAASAAAAAAAVAGGGALPRPSIMASAVRASLGVLSSKLEACLSAPVAAVEAGGAGQEEAPAHARAARAVALFAEYSDGLSALAQTAPMAETPGLWTQVCHDEGSKAQALPWGVLREVTLLVIWRPMQDDATALAPPVLGQIRPSEAVLEAESKAKKLMQMPPTWARHLEEKGGAMLAPVWMACTDATCEAYWKQWEGLVSIFKNTMESRGGADGASLGGTHNSALLNECLQLHSMLHDTISGEFLAFRKQVLQLAVRMHTAGETPLGCALTEKMKDDRWCEWLGVPSAGGLRAATAALEGLHPDLGTLAGQVGRALPLSAAALSKVEKQVRDLVTQCCVQPVVDTLAHYAEMKEWGKSDDVFDVSLLAGGLSPLPCITAVGEHLFALMPQLERTSEGGPQVHWLPDILEAMAEATTQRVLDVKHLSPLGAQQLITDLEYLHKVTDALGSGAAASPGGSEAAGASDASAKLGDLMAALTHLAAQQRRLRELASRGEEKSFVEASREGPPFQRRMEKALRATLGLP